MKIYTNHIVKYNPQLKNKNDSFNSLHSNIQDKDTIEISGKNTKEPSFTGIFSLFSKVGKNSATQSTHSLTKSGIPLDNITTVLTPKQIKNAKRDIANEIIELIKSPFSTAKDERMDKLVNSAYVDYQQVIYPYTLEDTVTYRHTTNNNKLYNRFLLNSLAKTMPLDNLEDKVKKDLYHNNDSIMLLFKSYLQMDEKSKDAQLIRDMILRLKEHDVNIKDYPSFFVDCLLNEKTEMCKFLQKTFNFNPKTRVKIVNSNKKTVEALSKNYASSTRKVLPYNSKDYSLRDDNLLVVYNQKFCADKDNEFLYKNLQNSTKEFSLWKIESLISKNKTKSLLDIPKYASEILFKETSYWSYYSNNNAKFGNFLFENRKQHPELNSFDFLENLALNLKAKKADYIDDICYYSKYLLEDKKKLDEAYDRLYQLKREHTPEAKEKTNVIKQLYIAIGKHCGIDEAALKSKLDALDKLPMEDSVRSVFIHYEDVESIEQLNLQQKRELLEKLIKYKSNLLDGKLGETVNVKFLPNNNSEYCNLIAKLSNSVGLNVKKLPQETITNFNQTMDKISKSDSEFMKIDFEHQIRRLNLDYNLEDFKKDLWYSTKDLSNVNRGIVLDFYGCELKNINGKLILNGFPNLQGRQDRLSKINDKTIVEKIKECESYIFEFTHNNKINIKGYPQASKDLTEISKAFPELLTTVGKIQSSTHDFPLDIHTLKVLQNLFKSPEYLKLKPESQSNLRLAALFHDITKTEGIVDKSHQDSSAFDVYYILQKLNLPEKDKLKIYNIIKNHTWLEQYNTQKGSDDFIKSLAFDLRYDDEFELSSILTKADLKSVKRDELMYDKFKKSLQSAYNSIKPLVYNLKETAINLPQSKIPKADKLNLKSASVSEINSNGIKNIVLHLKKGLNLSEVGFDSNISLDDLNILVHGLDDKDSASMFQALAIINSNAMLSTSYINYAKGNWKVFRTQGFVLNVPSFDIHAGYWRDFGSGYKKEKLNLIQNYLFSNCEMRNFFSSQLKNELNLTNKEYIDLYHKIENLPIEELDKTYPEVAKAYRNIFANMETHKRTYGRNYNEILVSHPKIQAIFCYNKSPELIPEYLRGYAQKHNIPILSFE